MVKVEPKYIGTLTRTQGFPSLPCCIDCRYMRHRNGLYDNDTKQFECFNCSLTLEPLSRQRIALEVGQYCPLTFEEYRKDDE